MDISSKNINSKKMTVCTSSAFLYRFPDKKSDMVDEALYGTTLEIKDEINGFYLVITDYGYKGWTAKENVCDILDEPNATVDISFCDLLPAPDYHLAPVMTLPLGSRVIAGVPHEVPQRAMIVLPDKKMYFTHLSHLVFDSELCGASCKSCKTPCGFKVKTASPVTRDRICASAERYLGVPYRWGGKTHAGIDCSGLAFMAYRLCGINIWRDSDPDSSRNMRRIPLCEAKKGDLLYFKKHVAVYLGDDRFIHASAKRGAVVCGNISENENMFKDFITATTYDGIDN